MNRLSLGVPRNVSRPRWVRRVNEGTEGCWSERCSHVAVIRNVATVFRPKAESGEWEKEREGGEKKEETRGKQNK